MGVKEAVARLGSGPLTEAGLQAHIRPLFGRVLAAEGTRYLANHTLGRLLDQTFEDVAEGLTAWADQMRGAWEPWLAEEQQYREQIAGLLGMARPDCVIPKASAGQALRAVLNSLPLGSTVVTTQGEFSSVAVILAQYAAMGRLRVEWVAPEPDGRWTPECMRAALTHSGGARLVIVSQVLYADGQVFSDLPALARSCREHGAELLIDAYHAVGVIPFAFAGLGCGYLIGGCYKYLRGGPGAAFLAVAPERLDGGAQTLDIGWFAQQPDTLARPQLRKGGDGWLDGTPAVLSYYQARAGLALVRALGVDRLRAYSLLQLTRLRNLLRERGIAAEGGDAGHGAFLTVASRRSDALVASLAKQGIIIDAVHGRLRICPDIVTTDADLVCVADALAAESGAAWA
jgi:kynureninase